MLLFMLVTMLAYLIGVFSGYEDVHNGTLRFSGEDHLLTGALKMWPIWAIYLMGVLVMVFTCNTSLIALLF